MGFTTVSRVKGGKAGLASSWTTVETKSCYFYPEDVAMILSQEGVAAVQICPAMFDTTDGNTTSSLVLIGLKPVLAVGKVVEFKRIDHNDALIALVCGHYNEEGAKWKENAKVDQNSTPLPVSPGS